MSTSRSHPKRSHLVALVLVAGAALLVWRWQAGQVAGRESAAKDELQQLGAIVVMDGGRRHVSSVNLSLISAAGGGEQFDRAVELLADLPQLSALDVSRTVFADAHARQLGQLRNLKSLTMIDATITDAALADISRLRQLEALNLANTKISGAGLASLAQLSSLKLLDISGTNVTDDLQSLAMLKSLEWLVMRSMKLDGQAVLSLASCPALRSLSLEGTIVSQDSLRSLKSKQPALRIHGGSPPQEDESLPGEAATDK